MARVYRRGLRVEVEDGDRLTLDAGAPAVALRRLMVWPGGVRLLLQPKDLRWNDQPLPSAPWLLSIAAPVALTPITPEEWSALRHLPRSVKRQLEAFADTRLYQVLQLRFVMEDLDLASQLREDESQLPSLEPGVRASVLRLLQQGLRAWTGPEALVPLMFTAISRAPTETAPEAPGFEPVHASWGVGMSPNLERAQLRVFLMTPDRTPPAPPEYPRWVSPRPGPERGALLLSPRLVYDRIIEPQLMERLALPQPFTTPGADASVRVNQRVTPRERLKERFQDKEGAWHTAHFDRFDTLDVRIHAEWNPEAPPRRRAAIVVSNTFRRSFLFLGLGLGGQPIPGESSALAVARLYLFSVGSQLHSESEVSFKVEITPETLRRMHYFAQWSDLHVRAMNVYRTVLNHYTDSLGELRFQLHLPQHRVLLPGGEQFIFSEPSVHPDSALMGRSCLQLNLVLKR